MQLPSKSQKEETKCQNCSMLTSTIILQYKTNYEPENREIFTKLSPKVKKNQKFLRKWGFFLEGRLAIRKKLFKFKGRELFDTEVEFYCLYKTSTIIIFVLLKFNSRSYLYIQTRLYP